MSSAATPGATCPRHPGEPTTFACARCGTFSCERCRSGPGGTLCPACEVWTREQAPLDFGAAVRDAFKLAMAQLGPLLPVLVIDLAFKIAVGTLKTRLAPPLAHATPGAGAFPAFAALFVIQTLFTVGMSAVDALLLSATDAIQIVRFADALRDQPRPLRVQVVAGLRRYLPMVATGLLFAVLIPIGMMACCLPGLALVVVVNFSQQEITLDGRGPLLAIRRSFERAVPLFWKLALLIVGEFVLVMGAGGVASVVSRLAHLDGAPKATVHEVLVATIGLACSYLMNAVLTTLYLRTRLPGPK